MFKGQLLVLIFLMSLKNFKLDLMFNHFRTKLGNWSKTMPKVWDGYIRMFFYKNLKNKTKMEGINNIIFQMLLKSKLLLLINKRQLGKKWKWKSYHSTICRECPVKQPIGLFLLKSPQFIYMYSLPHFNNEKMYKIQTYSYANWNLHARFKLNITFFTIYFFTVGSNWLKCFEDCLSINSGTLSSYIFCMQHSSFSYYSKEKRVTLTVRLDNCHDNEYYIEGIFMIIDKVQIESASLILKKAINPELVYDIGDKHILLRYFISVRKLDQIILKTQKLNTYEVFDGPGLLSDIMDITSNLITSTFQCLVLLLTLRGKRIHNENLIFTSKQISTKNQILITRIMNGMIYFPNNMCRKSLCISKVDASKGHQVNITATVVNSTVSHNFHCLKGGLLAVERFLTGYKESKTICESSEWNGNFYSHTSSFNIIMYWYKEYGEISASLMISQTKCKPVFINVCLLNLLAINSKEDVQTYIDEVTRFSNININLQNNSFYSFLYGVKMTQCVVFQFSSTYEDLRRDFVIGDINAFQHNTKEW